MNKPQLEHIIRAACREKDIDYVKSLLGSELLDVGELIKRLDALEGFDEQKNKARAIIKSFET